MSNDKLAATFHPAASAAPRAHRVIEGDTWHVALDLEPAAVLLIPDMARALTQAHLAGSLHIIGTVRPAHPLYAEHLHRITDALADALTVQLHPAAAERLSGDLWDAKDEPDLCRWGEGDCPNYADDGDFCPPHNNKADDVSARLRGA